MSQKECSELFLRLKRLSKGANLAQFYNAKTKAWNVSLLQKELKQAQDRNGGAGGNSKSSSSSSKRLDVDDEVLSEFGGVPLREDFVQEDAKRRRLEREDEEAAARRERAVVGGVDGRGLDDAGVLVGENASKSLEEPAWFEHPPPRSGDPIRATVVAFDAEKNRGWVTGPDFARKATFKMPASQEQGARNGGKPTFSVGDSVSFERVTWFPNGVPEAQGVQRVEHYQDEDEQRGQDSREREDKERGDGIEMRNEEPHEQPKVELQKAKIKPMIKPIRFTDLPLEKQFPGQQQHSASASSTAAGRKPGTASMAPEKSAPSGGISLLARKQDNVAATTSAAGDEPVVLARNSKPVNSAMTLTSAAAAAAAPSSSSSSHSANPPDGVLPKKAKLVPGPSGKVRDVARVVRWMEKKGYGYIESDKLYNEHGCQIFVHCHDLDDPELDIREGDEVYYGQLARNERHQLYATGVRLKDPLVAAERKRVHTSVFFSNVPFKYTEAELMEFFLRHCGPVSHFKLFLDPHGRSRGQGVVRFCDEVSFEKALALHDTRIRPSDPANRLLCVEQSRFHIPIGKADAPPTPATGGGEQGNNTGHHGGASSSSKRGEVEDERAAEEEMDVEEPSSSPKNRHGRRRQEPREDDVAANVDEERNRDVENFLKKERFPKNRGGPAKRRGRW
ncbi:unnamed protein product [Amoebophrya sp. A120]|nr:unnamed protein product [Amoebophrya sp. A120]|eukprot:GSA120T00020160001.1